MQHSLARRLVTALVALAAALSFAPSAGAADYFAVETFDCDAGIATTTQPNSG